ncbi:MAG: outer membrane beta-barrel protein [Bacteroidia bacterium]|nr:outer membrane beta-barrel protein [Bacteroidia bacterium]
MIKNVGVGTYKVVVSFIGYETQIFDVVIADGKDDADLGTVKLASSSKVLGEVTVEGQKELIEERVDRTIYNAEHDATAKGGDATDVLKRVPMLAVDMDGNVSLRGNSNIRVLINNKPSTIAASSVADALKQIPADQIKSVEVITSPSAKYDAEGSAGIINIITKKNTLQGLTLMVNGSAGMRGSNLGLNGNYRQGKMGFSLGGWGRANYNVNGAFENNQTTFSDSDNDGINDLKLSTIQSADTRNENLFGNYTFGWDWDITKNDFVIASVRYGLRNGNNYQDNLLSQSFENDVATGTSLQKVKTTDQSGTVDVNLTYTHLYAKPQKELSVLASYSRNNRTNDFERLVLEGSNASTLNNNDSYNEEMTIQADYQSPIGKTQLVEFGGKEILRKVSSEYQYFFADDQGVYQPSTDVSQSNTFNYEQNVMAGYLRTRSLCRNRTA